MLQRIRRQSHPTTQPALVPFRDGNSLSYAPSAPAFSGTNYASYVTSLHPEEREFNDDESTMHLIPPPAAETELDEDAIERFTATGRPMPKYRNSAWGNLVVGGCGQQPAYMPFRFTDDSVIPVVVKLPPPSATTANPPSPDENEEMTGANGERRKSFLGKLKKGKTGGKEKEEVKIVWMPRRDYLKWFAKDEMGVYKGSEPKRDWTKEELDREFGRYFKELGPRKR